MIAFTISVEYHPDDEEVTALEIVDDIKVNLEGMPIFVGADAAGFITVNSIVEGYPVNV